MKVTFLLAIGLVVVSACSTAESSPDGMLAVLDDDNVVVMDRGGDDRLAITDANAPGPDRAFYFQPVWSPDNTFLAFGQVGPGTGLHIAAADGNGSASIDTGTLPFYYSWSTGNELASLRNGEDGALRLDLASWDEDSITDVTLLDSGAPLYFSWSPDEARLVTHIGPDRLELHDLTSSQPLGPLPGSFQAPQWTDRGIFVLERGARDQTLALVDQDGSSGSVARVLGPTNFVATDDGARIALQTNLGETNGISAAYQQLQSVVPDRVVVIDVTNGEQTAVTDGPALAFFWSPGGDELLILDIDPGGLARWSVWSDGELRPAVSFEPEPSFVRNFLPFFDQYAQSMSLWSPDGSAFAFPGTIDGESGIWVKSADSDPIRISGGTWVSWSN